MEKSSMVMWPDHKTKKRSAYEISLWFCNLWFPLHICSVSLVSLSYHEPPASFFWLLILWVILSWIPLMSPKYLNGSSHISPLQIRTPIYLLLFYHNWILSSGFLVLQSYLRLAAVILRSFIFLLLKCIWEQQRCPFSPMHNLRLHLQKTDLHKKDSLHDINAARHQSLCKVPPHQSAVPKIWPQLHALSSLEGPSWFVLNVHINQTQRMWRADNTLFCKNVSVLIMLEFVVLWTSCELTLVSAK